MFGIIFLIGLYLTISGALTGQIWFLVIGITVLGFFILPVLLGVLHVIRVRKFMHSMIEQIQAENEILYWTAAAVLKNIAEAHGSGRQELIRAREHLVSLSNGELSQAEADSLLQEVSGKDLQFTFDPNSEIVFVFETSSNQNTAARLNEEQRYILLRLAIDVAAVDGRVSTNERSRLENLADQLSIPYYVLNSLLDSLFGEPEIKVKEKLEKAYETLGVKPGASVGEIRTARNNLMLKHHPDKANRKSKEAAHRKATQINAAYDLLIGRR